MLLRHILIVVAILELVQTQAQVPIGQWRDHFTYRNAIAVTEGDGKAFASTKAAVYSVELETGEIQRITKANFLSDVGISTIRWNQALGALVVAYSNGNLDLIQGDQRFNINDIDQSNVVGNKSINHIHFEESIAYLSCGFGVVVMDLSAREVKETWLIGPGGSQLATNSVEFYGDSIYIATDQGLYTAWKDNVNLGAFSSWRKRQDLAQPNGPFDAVIAFGGNLLVNLNAGSADTLYLWNGVDWQQVSSTAGRKNLTLELAPDESSLVICHKGDARVYDGSMTETASTFGYLNGTANVDALQATVTAAGEMLIADTKFGLVRSPGWDLGVPVLPNGPNGSEVVRMDAAGGGLYIATGSVAGNWTNEYHKSGVFHFVDGVWGYTDQTNTPMMMDQNGFGGGTVDILAVAVDPKDPLHAYAGSWDEGLLEIVNKDVVAKFNASNSSLQNEGGFLPTEKVNVAGIDFDADGNLWVTNANVDEPISVRTTSGSWISYGPEATVLNGNTLLGDILAASNGYKWIIRPRSNGMLVFNDNGTLSNKNDDQYKVLNTFEGQGGLPDINVLSIAEDPDGEVWVGTGKGIAVFYNPDAIFNGGDFDAQQILIEQDGNVQILLETEAIAAIEIDGAGRKWIGTQSSGVFLFSENGTEEIHHFTLENSPMPSNTVLNIAIDGASGEVFIATDNGIIGYQGDATEGAEESDCATVFPNPVQSSYTGPIAIDGLAADSDVKITDISGNLVYTTTSKGGRAIWPGTDLTGERVATGVYLAMATDRFGQQTCMTKVLMVR